MKEKANKLNSSSLVEGINGVLHFASGESFYEVLGQLGNMTELERNRWESELGFVSQRTIVDKAYSEIDKARNEEELFKILEINNDILTINPDSEVVPRLDFGQYPMIVNRKGYFYVNNILHKVTNDKIYVAKTTGETDLDEIILNEGEKSDRVVIINNKIIQLTKSCTGDHSAEITEGNRRAKIYMSAYVAFANDGYYWYCQDYVDWTIKGFKKVLGIWYSYNTLYTYRNVAFEVNAMYDIYYEIPHDYQQSLPEFRVQSGSYPGPVDTTVESKSATWSAPVGDLIKSSYTYYPNILPVPNFIKVRGEGSSRGTAGYAIISCGY